LAGILFEGVAGVSTCVAFIAQFSRRDPAILIGATAIPVCSENRTLLPAHFLTSGLGCSAGMLELAGFLIPLTQVLGFVASGLETLIEIFLEVRRRPVDAPLHHGRSGATLRIAGLLEVPPLSCCVFSGARLRRDDMPPPVVF
jgi:hypothetical protein